MLPPVGAASSASADHQTASRQAIRTVAAPVGTSVTRLPVPADLLGSGRLDLLALSGQVQLAQGVSILVEAIGQYLRIARREGETPTDYANRLADALKTLTAPQRAMLEQILSQVAKGITLHMLSEILSNPMGPEAARLSLHMEASLLQGRDPIAGAVVSSYRQNAAEPTAGSLPPRMPAPPATTGGAEATRLPPQAGPPTPPASPAAAIAAGDIRPAQPSAPRLPMHTGASLLPGKAGSTVPQTTMTIPAAMGSGAAGPGNPAAGPRQPPAVQASAPPPADGTRPQATGPAAGNPPARTSSMTPSMPVSEHAGAAPPRGGIANATPVPYTTPMPERTAESQQDAARHANGQEVRYLAERLGAQPAPASLAQALTRPGTPPLPPAPLDIGEAAGDAEDASTLRPDNRTDGRVRTAGTGTEAPAEMLRASLPASVDPSAARTTGLNAFLEQALMLPMAALVAREGFAQPLIAYPPVPAPIEDEERDVERVSAVEEDDQGHSAARDGEDGSEDGEEEAEANADEPDTGAPETDDGASAGDDSRQAQDFYRQMTDFS